MTEQVKSVLGNLKFFPAMYRGSYDDEAAALANSNLPAGSIQESEVINMVRAAKMLIYQAPAGSTDGDGKLLLILSPAPGGACNLWFTSLDMASETIEQAMDDVEEFEAIGGGGFQIFEL
ncbi:hypothetical protein ACO0LF_13825 [Undibacterium sp. Di27W]|uniref:hypothetical protein n=1 Tax=Undibacterium sp. Di27W TaxID=3413036 RepID=UPI003BF20C69